MKFKTAAFILAAMSAYAFAFQSAFEVASVKPNKTGRKTEVSASPDGLTMRFVSLRDCLLWAYDIPNYQFPGENRGAERFDILAKAEAPTGKDQLRLMLQTLLADEFKVKLHWEPKTLDGYILRVGKGGHRLRPSEDGRPLVHVSGMAVQAASISVEQFAEKVSHSFNIPIRNETGIDGLFDFTLDVNRFLDPSFFERKVPPEQLRPDLLLAVEEAMHEELGLKLERTKVPTKVLVLDHAEVPR
jgi:uncharacterized protein (TIGR03435 family)